MKEFYFRFKYLKTYEKNNKNYHPLNKNNL